MVEQKPESDANYTKKWLPSWELKPGASLIDRAYEQICTESSGRIRKLQVENILFVEARFRRSQQEHMFWVSELINTQLVKLSQETDVIPDWCQNLWKTSEKHVILVPWIVLHYKKNVKPCVLKHTHMPWHTWAHGLEFTCWAALPRGRIFKIPTTFWKKSFQLLKLLPFYAEVSPVCLF